MSDNLTKIVQGPTNSFSDFVADMGYHPSFRLGKHLQGRKDPIQPEQQRPRQGLGFS